MLALNVPRQYVDLTYLLYVYDTKSTLSVGWHQ